MRLNAIEEVLRVRVDKVLREAYRHTALSKVSICRVLIKVLTKYIEDV